MAKTFTFSSLMGYMVLYLKIKLFHNRMNNLLLNVRMSVIPGQNFSLLP